MRQGLLRDLVLMTAWAIGLLLAVGVVPGASLSAGAFILAVALFSVGQATLSVWILKLPERYASLVLGGSGLALTVIAMWLAAMFTGGLDLRGAESWVAATMVVWLVTTIGAIIWPVFVRDQVSSI
ncbi:MULTISPECIES: hypothetical protein [Mycobacterium]|jgi:hypothetical protein|uniref:Phage holin family protein n=1 Tax=Mycobacterium gordonae TaxID=1778 RepID=A0A1A6BND0_MYCGO|nr:MULTISPECIES: hypothetical protein [Mycobacterium]MBI2701300.1 hypothetical protein [Mycobacterium sp.]MBX9979262.1 hypothetical protein [Mycobacterium gordonae]MCQ4362126.1 hypothetical protein [Mycobacterium gordonae]MCV7004526.1 hypothetical protein [Mycobacterium gordonae]OBS03709.1 hypothetical protein A9W98_08245 [Mycobacterium gordonae]